MKKKSILLILILLSLNNLFSVDFVVLKDGTIQLGTVISYEKDNSLIFEKNDGLIETYLSTNVLTIRTDVDLDKVITQTLSPTYNMIHYYPRKDMGAYSSPPRYVYQGQSYNMESMLGYPTQILEFFDILDKTGMDKNTEFLINKLEGQLKKNNTIVTASLISQIIGGSLMFVPYFVMDDSTSPVVIPDWARYTGIAGATIDIVGLSLFITRLGFNTDELVEEIALSYNKNLAKQS